MFKTSFFINISKRYLIYILRLFLYTPNFILRGNWQENMCPLKFF